MKEYIIKKRRYDLDRELIEKEVELIANSIMKKSKEPIACIHTDYIIDPMNFEVRYRVKIETLEDLEKKYNKEVIK